MKSVKEQPFRVSCGFSPTVLLVSFTIMIILFILRQRPPGEMASRLTTNQEIAGSIPAVVIYIFAHGPCTEQITTDFFLLSTSIIKQLDSFETP